MKAQRLLICFVMFMTFLWFFEAKAATPLTLNEADLASKNYNFPKSSLSKQEVKAIGHAAAGRFDEAMALIGKKPKPHLKELVLWLAAVSGKGNLRFEAIGGLYDISPDWPRAQTLREAYEMDMPSSMTDKDIIAFFKDQEPMTEEGVTRYASAFLHQGRKDDAHAAIRKWWVFSAPTRENQKAFLSKYESWLTMEDHAMRIQTLLAPSAYRYENATALARYMKGDWPLYVETRIALQNPGRAMNVDGLMARVKSEAPKLLNDPYFVRDRFYWQKSQESPENDLRAVDMLSAVKTWPDYIPNQRNWWLQQRIMINRFVARNMYDKAYQLAQINPFNGGEAESDMAFIAGWLALRKMNMPSQAAIHFGRMYNAVSTANSASQAAYWLGRAYEALGDKAESGKWYGTASNFPYNFYGQLSSEKPTCLPQPLPVADNKGKTPDFAAYFANSPFPSMYQYLLQADRVVTAYGFLDVLSKQTKTTEDVQMLSDFALASGNQFHALMIAKQGYNLDYHQVGRAAFPVLGMDILKDMNLKPLAHAIIRQESGFNPEAVSRAGAMGLMQMMPFVAKKEASRLGIKYRSEAVFNEPPYNVRLGESHLNHLLEVNKGHHIMRVLAGYNAGMGRVKEWIAIYGDPGSKESDPIDWMESLPFGETRDYVRKVLENYVIYHRIFSDKSYELGYITSCNKK